MLPTSPLFYHRTFLSLAHTHYPLLRMQVLSASLNNHRIRFSVLLPLLRLLRLLLRLILLPQLLLLIVQQLLIDLGAFTRLVSVRFRKSSRVLLRELVFCSRLAGFTL